MTSEQLARGIDSFDERDGVGMAGAGSRAAGPALRALSSPARPSSGASTAVMPSAVLRPASRALAMKAPCEAPLRVLAQLGDRRRVPNASAPVNRPDELDHVSGALEMRAGRRVEPAVCSMEHGRPALGRRIRYGCRQPSAASFFSGVHRHLLHGLWWLSEREEETARTQRTVYRSLRVIPKEVGAFFCVAPAPRHVAGLIARADVVRAPASGAGRR
jgi:hypothetical protein